MNFSGYYCIIGLISALALIGFENLERRDHMSLNESQIAKLNTRESSLHGQLDVASIEADILYATYLELRAKGLPCDEAKRAYDAAEIAKVEISDERKRVIVELNKFVG